MQLARFVVVIVSISISAGVARAVDGVLEINQACALNTGCFAGDAAGFPVQIAVSGSYRLTGSLAVPASTQGIQVTTPRVSIDLNGFEVAGAGTCSGFPASACTGTDTGISGIEGLVVRNGTVRGFEFGITSLKRGVVIEDVLLEQNANHALTVGQNARVSNCRALQNGGNGIFLRDDDGNPATIPNGISIAENNVTSGNGGHGILANTTTAPRVSDNVSDNNAFSGITVTAGAVAGNVVFDNGTGTIGFGTAAETGTNLCNGSTTCP